MKSECCVALWLCASLGVPVAGQAQLTPAPSDTITKLAVDPAKFAGRPAVILLDQVTHRIEPDGRWISEGRQVFQVIAQQAARGYSERSFQWSPKHQDFALKWVRVLKPTGEVVSEKVAQEQDSDLPAPLNNPIYQERKQKRISLSGVAAGTLVDMSWVHEEKGPYRPGDFLFQWNFQSALPVVLSRFMLDVPQSFQPRIDERNLTFKRTESVVANRKLLTWTRTEIPAYRPAPFEPDSNGVTMSVHVSAPSSWNDIAKWYDGLAKDRYTLPPAVATRIDSIVTASNAKNRLDTIRAVHRWVAQDIRYVSLALGMGGYQPRTPAEVLETGFGDCKDKATIFIGAMRRYRIPADPVILSIRGSADRQLPSMYQFDHVIAAVGQGNSRTYTDLTAEFIPYGEIADSYGQSFAIIVKPNGTAEEVQLPRAPVDSNVSVLRANLMLDTTGTLRGVIEQEARGVPAVPMRNVFSQPLDSARRAMILRSLSQGMFQNSTADSLVAFNGRDLSAPVKISYNISLPTSMRTVSDSRVLSLPNLIRGNAAGYGARARDLAAQPARVTPVDASKILGMLVTTTDVRIRLPRGWKAELPKNVLSTSFFGSYESTWTQEGDEVRLVRRIRGQRGIHPQERIVEVVEWMKTTSTDVNEFLTLKPPAAQ